MIMAAGGAVNESLDRRLMKDANKFAGRWLHEKVIWNGDEGI